MDTLTNQNTQRVKYIADLAEDVVTLADLEQRAITEALYHRADLVRRLASDGAQVDARDLTWLDWREE